VITFVDAANIDPALLPAIFGLTLVIFLIFEPRGIAHRWAVIQASWKLRPFSQM
jgi:branched-chain amino acid transport system permease protein